MRIKSRTNCRAATESGHRSPRRARLSLAIAALATPALVGGVALAAPATAATTFTSAIATEVGLPSVLDVSGASTQDGAEVIDWQANGGTNQQWTFQPLGFDDYGAPVYEIVNLNSGLCLTTNDAPGLNLFQEPCLFQARGHEVNKSQAWATNLNPSQPYTYNPIISMFYYAGQPLCVDVYENNPSPGAEIDSYTCNRGFNQGFWADTQD
jgi:hypothetical protein